MRQEPSGVEAEVVIPRAPRDGGRGCPVDDESRDAVLVFKLACDGETRWAGPDNNRIAVVLRPRDHRRSHFCRPTTATGRGRWSLVASSMPSIASAPCTPSKN